MNINQLNKFKNHLANTYTQIQSASSKLSNDTAEQLINTKLLEAKKLIRDAIDLAENIKAVETPPVQPSSKKKKRGNIGPAEVVIIRHDNAVKRQYNIMCKNYSEVRDSGGNVLERGCVVGMDMDYCSKNCPYATNNVCSLKA